jgi:hypothetical protein
MNTRIVWKPYLDYEKEEVWLNKMAADGWELQRYTWMRYRFERGEPGRYTYRIELLPRLASAPESREYFEFMKEAGVEVVSEYGQWVYFRKESAEGPFEVFSDLDSRIAHHKRIATMFGVLAGAILPGVMVAATEIGARAWLVPIAALEIWALGAMLWVALGHYRRALALGQQRRIHE